MCFLACTVAKSCLTLCLIKYYSPSGSSVLGIFQARILEWNPDWKRRSKPLTVCR